MRKIALVLLICITMGLAACPVENDARDAAAALGGSLVAAQAKYQASCQPNPSQSVCQKINQGISAQNALITATQAYCGWASAAPPPVGTKCVAIKGAKAGFETAIANVKQITKEIKGAI